MKIKLTLALFLISHICFARGLDFKTSPSYFSNAQNDTGKHSRVDYESRIAHIGFQSGLNISNIIYSNSSYFKGEITGFNAGININIQVEFNFSFNAALLYSQKGYHAETGYGNYNQHLNFIDLPVLLKSSSANGKFNFFWGPQFSYLVSASTILENGFTGNPGNYEYTAAKFFIDGAIGIGYDFSRYFDIHVMYTIDINQTNSKSIYIPNYRNQIYQLGLGIKFN